MIRYINFKYSHLFDTIKTTVIDNQDQKCAMFQNWTKE